MQSVGGNFGENSANGQYSVREPHGLERKQDCEAERGESAGGGEVISNKAEKRKHA